VREGVDVKLLPQDQELYVLAQSHARIDKERAMRRRKVKWLWARLKEIAAMPRVPRHGWLGASSMSRWRQRAPRERPPRAGSRQATNAIRRAADRFPRRGPSMVPIPDDVVRTADRDGKLIKTAVRLGNVPPPADSGAAQIARRNDFSAEGTLERPQGRGASTGFLLNVLIDPQHRHRIVQHSSNFSRASGPR
jgi:hypothetical protein